MTNQIKADISDPIITRYRPTIIVADDNMQGDTGTKRAVWERNRNHAESTKITCLVQGWFKDDGKLWQVNEVVRIVATSLNLSTDLLITECTYTLDENGALTQLVLMHRDAMTAEPISLKQKSTEEVKFDE